MVLEGDYFREQRLPSTQLDEICLMSLQEAIDRAETLLLQRLAFRGGAELPMSAYFHLANTNGGN